MTLAEVLSFLDLNLFQDHDGHMYLSIDSQTQRYWENNSVHETIKFENTVTWKRNGVRHRSRGLPAVVEYHPNICKRKEWWSLGDRHRSGDLPAFMCFALGRSVQMFVTSWWRCGQRHREGDLPALIDEKREGWPWMDHGKLQEWWWHNKRHRKKGQPAVIKKNGDKEWWWHGVNTQLSKKPMVGDQYYIY